MTKKDRYFSALREIDIRLEKGGDLIADLGNIAAVLKKRMSHFYWVGFYFVRKDNLILGPFQGTPACVILEIGKGVCGLCAIEEKTIIVPDVHSFSGHVACDPHSKSEIAIPCMNQTNELKAVLDVDSDQINAFDYLDQRYLETLADQIRTVWR